MAKIFDLTTQTLIHYADEARVPAPGAEDNAAIAHFEASNTFKISNHRGGVWLDEIEARRLMSYLQTALAS